MEEGAQLELQLWEDVALPELECGMGTRGDTGKECSDRSQLWPSSLCSCSSFAQPHQEPQGKEFIM